MIRKLICPVCQEEFVTDRNAQVYCSARCRRRMEAKKKRDSKPTIRTFTCDWCGKEFLSDRRKKYCSKECRFRANGRGPKKKKVPPKMSLEEIARASREAGLTYGQYVAKMGL